MKGEFNKLYNACQDGDIQDGFTPLYIACEKGHLEVVKYLMSLDVDINKSDNNSGTTLLLYSSMPIKSIIYIINYNFEMLRI
jgi:ankyrin repeat protein